MFKEGNAHILHFIIDLRKSKTTRIVKTSEKSAEANRPDLKKKKSKKKEKTAHREEIQQFRSR